MGNADMLYPGQDKGSLESGRAVVPPSRPFVDALKDNLKEIFFADDPFRKINKERSVSKRVLVGLKYFLPVLEWLPNYNLSFFKSDLIAGITVASLAIPQGISYAKLADLPPVVGLYSSFVPPIVYTIMGTSRDLSIGAVAISSIVMASMLGQVVSPIQQPSLYLQLAFTTTFFTGLFQAALGFFRLGFIIDFLSKAMTVGFMAGAAIVVCLQQMKGLLGLHHFTSETDIVSVMKSVFSQTSQWTWQTAMIGTSFLAFLLITRAFSKKYPKFFMISALAPLTSVAIATLFVYLTHAENKGVAVIGHISKGLNPPSSTMLIFSTSYIFLTFKTGVITGILALSEGTTVGRSFALLKNYHIDGNKEMIAYGMMNIVGSLTSCYITAGPISRTALNANAGCKTAMSNIVTAITVMITLLVLTPLFYYTPAAVLSSIVISAMLTLIDFKAFVKIWKVDKLDFCTCLGAFLGVLFCSAEIGLLVSVVIQILRVMLFVARPRTTVLGNIPDSGVYRRKDQYPLAQSVPGILILQIDSPIYFASSTYLRERIPRWIEEEEEKLNSESGTRSLQYVILNLEAAGGIDTSGLSMLKDQKKSLDKKSLQLVLANPGSEIMKKLDASKVLQTIGEEWIFSNLAEAVAACTLKRHNHQKEVVPGDV